MSKPILSMEIRLEHDVVAARQRARQIAGLLGFEAQDQVRVATAVSEVARNAFQYAGGGKVEFLLDEGMSPVFRIRLRDHGPGIPDLKAILEGHYQSATGMGLGIRGVRRLAELHGGTVEAFSAGSGRGSEFVVRLPLAPEEAPAPGKPAAQAGRSWHAARRVLVVDDNRDSAESLAMLLRLMGHDVRTSYDGQLALEVATAYRPDVVVLDIGLPGLSGLEVCQRLRANPDVGQAVMVAMTGYGQEEDKHRSREAGFDAHLVKPVDLEALQGLLARPELTRPRHVEQPQTEQP